MDLLFGSSRPQVTALKPPLSIFFGYTRPHPMHLALQNRAFNVQNDTSSIVDQNGHPVVQVSNRPFSLSKFKTVSDPQGNVLFQMRSKPISEAYVCELNGREFFRIQRKFTWSMQLSAKIGDATVLKLKGSDGGSRAKVVDSAGNVVAAVTMEEGRFLSTKQEYHCDVGPGVDLAVLCALCLAWDDTKQVDEVMDGLWE